MPYYTKKFKDKTCVYKKSNNERVGCTKGSVEKYLKALHINEKIKLKDIIKNLTEEKKSQVQSGKKRITIELNDSTGDFEKLIRWWESMGNIGHSAVIHCDVEQPSNMVKFFCDGDGPDRIQSIKVEKINED